MIEEIIDKMANIVGDERIVKKLETCVVSPESVEEVQKIIQTANQNKIQLFTNTCDDNFHWVPEISSDGVFLDSNRMNTIINVDTKSRSVIIEPGVTFFQLQNELKKYGLRAMNPIGLVASTPVLSCYLERAPLLSAPKPLLANGWQCILDMEIVLPTGDILKTGAASLVDVEKPFFWPFGGGPDLSRVFTASQGTLGVVTKATIKVKAIPELRKIIFIPFNNVEDAIDTLYRIQRVEIGEECLLLNSFNLSLILSEDKAKHVTIKNDLPPWTLVLCLAGTEEKIKYQEEDLKDLGILLQNQPPNMEKFKVDLLDEFSNPQRISRLLEYKKICRKISFYTTLDRLQDINEKVLYLIRKHNYPENELGTFVMPIELGRACFSEYYIFANQPDEVRLKTLYIELYESLYNLGANIDRPYGQIAKIVYGKNPALQRILRMVKDQLDPNKIMNTNRLLISD